MNNTIKVELSSHEGTRSEFNPGKMVIKLGIAPPPALALEVPEWLKELLWNSQPILLALEEKIRAVSVQLQAAATPGQPRGLGMMTSVVISSRALPLPLARWVLFFQRLILLSVPQARDHLINAIGGRGT